MDTIQTWVYFGLAQWTHYIYILNFPHVWNTSKLTFLGAIFFSYTKPHPSVSMLLSNSEFIQVETTNNLSMKKNMLKYILWERKNHNLYNIVIVTSEPIPWITCPMVTLCTVTNNSTMKSKEEWRYTPLILTLDTRRMWVVSFMPQPLYFQTKSPQYSLVRRLGAAQRWQECCREDKHLVPAWNRSLSPLLSSQYNMQHSHFVNSFMMVM
jgi:hypothetical protein